MTRQEVEAILGPPGDYSARPHAAAPSGWEDEDQPHWLVWDTDHASVAVILRKGSNTVIDESLQKVISQIPQQKQRQYSTDEQLRILRIAAVRLGLYDADDAIASALLARPGDFHK